MLQCPSAHWSLKKKKPKETDPEQGKWIHIFFLHIFQITVSHCFSVADFQNNPPPISCWHLAGERKRAHGSSKFKLSWVQMNLLPYLSQLFSFFHISVLRGNARSLSDPSPLHSTCQLASQAEQWRRNGHNETDDNKAEDGEMTEWDGATI